jgi:hypothetical protein
MKPPKLTDAERRVSLDLIRPFLAAMGRNYSLPAAAAIIGAPAGMISRWTNGQQLLPVEYHAAVALFVAAPPPQQPKTKGAIRKSAKAASQ